MKKVLLAIVAVLFMAVSNLYAVDFAGEFQEIDGDIFVIRKGTTDKLPATVGMKLSVGDKIETGTDAEAEVLYDDGNITVIDENTTITIAELSIGENKSTTSIFNLSLGTVKNYVTKIAGARIKFEIHTKSAVAGVTGTPPWIVTAKRGSSGKIQTSVDLLGKAGQKGGVSVRALLGRGAGKMIRLKPATRTVVRQGFAPKKPFKISAVRHESLSKKLIIKTAPEKRSEKRKEIKKKIEKAAKENAESKKEEKKEEKKKDEDATKDDESKDEAKDASTDESKSDDSAIDDSAKSDSTETTTDATATDATGATDATTTTDTASTSSTTTATSTSSTVGLSTNGMINHVVNNVSVGAITTPVADTTGQQSETTTTGGTLPNQNVVTPTTSKVTVKVNIQ